MSTANKNEHAVRNVRTGVFTIFTVQDERVLVTKTDAKTVLGSEYMSKDEARVEWLNLRNWNGHVPCAVP